jgi:DNA-directed RNA polymerase subunit RPC12/RpoP
MALTVLVAGIGKDERARVEGAVKAALGWRGLTEAWTASLVKVGGQWSVTLNGPGERFRNLSFGATEQQLGEKITGAIGGPEPAPAAAPAVVPSVPPAAASAETPRHSAPVPTRSGAPDGRYTCLDCGGTFVVLYEPHPNDAQVMAAVACPHCWKVNHVEIGSWAAEGRDYRAEKA